MNPRNNEKDETITIIDEKTDEKQKFIWSKKKEAMTILERGITFRTAALVFFDDSKISRFDTKHDSKEDRFQVIGFSGETLFVVATEQDLNFKKPIRIISARKARGKEIDRYHRENNLTNGTRNPPRGRKY